jgi:hypothetical protein
MKRKRKRKRKRVTVDDALCEQVWERRFSEMTCCMRRILFRVKVEGGTIRRRFGVQRWKMVAVVLCL